MSDILHVEVSGSGDPVVFLPGFSTSISDYLSIRARLSRCHHVISVDLPGSGQSGPQPRHYARTYLEEDARTIAALVRSTSSAPAHLVGHSDGGEVALLIAATDHAIARSVVTWGAAGALNASHQSTVAFLDGLMDDTSDDTAAYRGHLVAAYGKRGARSTTKSFAQAIAGILRSGGDISRSRAQGIQCPLLMVTGENDHFAPPSLVEAYVDLVPNAASWIVLGAGHDLHDTHKEVFENHVVNWINRCS